MDLLATAQNAADEIITQMQNIAETIPEYKVLRAMNDKLDPNFLGTAKSSRSTDNKLKPEEFDQLCSDIEKTLGSVRNTMLSGEASAKPRQKKGFSPCDYCDYRAVCRSAKPSKKHK